MKDKVLPLVPYDGTRFGDDGVIQRDADYRRVDLPLEKARNAALTLRRIAEQLDPPGGPQSERDCELLTLAVVAGEELVQALAQIGVEVGR